MYAIYLGNIHGDLYESEHHTVQYIVLAGTD